jgi:hypothetical protein
MTRRLRIAFPETEEAAATGSPFLAFSDLLSGPATGNTDTSFGATAGVDGCYVSVWGNRLGSGGTNSSITIGGVACRTVYWGPAVRPWSPANLVNGYHEMDLIIAQVMSTAASGATTIQVTVDGETSNTLPFTVRTGRILYFTSAGTAGGTGSWTEPLDFTRATFNLKVNQSGDTCYVKDISKSTQTRIGDGGTNGLNGYTMTEARPGAIVGYPGSINQFGTYGPDEAHSAFTLFDGIVALNGTYPEYYVPWWTFSKIDLRGEQLPLLVKGGRTRLVGSTYSNPTGTPRDWPVYSVQEYCKLLGNEWFNIGEPGSWTHTNYVSTGYYRSMESENPSSNQFGIYPPYVLGDGTYEIAWNYYHDCMVYDAYHIFNFNISVSGTTDNFYENDIDALSVYSSYMGGGYCHHNVIVDHAGSGVSLTNMVGGTTYIWSNIMVRPGATVNGQEWSSSNAFRLTGGVQTVDLAGTGGPMTVYVWHNTIYDAGIAGITSNISGDTSTQYGVITFGGTGREYSINLQNNIFYQYSGVRYVGQGSDSSPSASEMQSSNNLWYGSGVPPTWEVSAVNSDPLVVEAGVTYPDLALQETSPARGAAAAITSPPVTLYDFHGFPIGTSSGADLGAIQFQEPEEETTDLPTWLASADVYEVVQIAGTTISTDYVPSVTGSFPAASRSPQRHIVDSESGCVIKEDDSTILFPWTGGHNDGCFNQIVGLRLSDDVPAFEEFDVGSAPEDIPSSPQTGETLIYLSDGRPIGCHNYERAYFLTSEQRIVRVQSPATWAWAATRNDCISYDWATKTTDAPGTFPSGPWSGTGLIQTSTCINRETEDIYAWYNTHLWKWTRLSNSWGGAPWKTGLPTNGMNRPMACNGEQIVIAYGAVVGAPAYVYVVDLNSTALTGPFTVTGPGAIGFADIRGDSLSGTRARLIWIPPIGKYFLMRGDSATNNNVIYTLQWDGANWYSEALELTGVAIPAQTTLGPQSKMQWVPGLNGVFYADTGTNDMFFFRVPEAGDPP